MFHANDFNATQNKRKGLVPPIKLNNQLKVIHLKYTLQEEQLILTIFKHFSQSWLGFTMVIYVTIYMEAYINNQYISLENNTVQFYLIFIKNKLYNYMFTVFQIESISLIESEEFRETSNRRTIEIP